MKTELRKKVNKLCESSIALRRLARNSGYVKGEKIRQEQDKVYNKYLFYKNMLEAMGNEEQRIKK